MLKSIALAAALSLASLALAAPAAYANEEDAVATANLAQPVAKSTQIIAGGVVWTCKELTCSGPATSDGAPSVSACKALVHSVGPVTAYRVESQKLSSDELQRCDGGKLPS